ncbi:MAG: peptidoglycan bridge formation glycyltransferase FemA/FemB family protein [Anaerolineaceae bacterium]|nr:peptidoglycan bridge formation glycyltransferase FemA/FemB family protein [Anaerolineaceae bacterium]
MNAGSWNQLISSLPGAHVLQTWEWAELKQGNGWKMIPQTWQDNKGKVEAAAMILERSISFSGLRILYIPRGPILDWGDIPLRKRVLDDLQQLAKKRRAIFIKIDPEVILGCGIPESPDAQENPTGCSVESDLKERGWLFSESQVQFRNTVWLDLNGSEDELLGRMKQKSRYNLHLAERKGVCLRTATLADLPMLYKMYAETSVRDGFVIRPENYYHKIWETFIQGQMAEGLIAEVDGEPVGGIILFHFAGKAWYLYGMSRQAHREKMPNYLLQWEAMRRAKAFGCMYYDLWGAPDIFNETDAMWGVFRFKEGLGGKVIRSVGAWDYSPRPIYYSLYTQVLPRVLDIMRNRGKARTRQEVAL